MSRARLEFAIESSAIRGARSNQEDCADLWRPAPRGNGEIRPLLAVLSDGMGGHVSGEVASRLACTHYIKAFSSEQGSVGPRLDQSLVASNDALNMAIRSNPKLGGMGCTMVAGYLDADGLRWVSVGDSLLLHYRNGELHRLNDDHSMGALLDKHAAANIITWEEAKSSPQRRTLRSALTGGTIALKDVVSDATPLEHGDWILLASDGLETLNGNEIAKIVKELENADPRTMVARLLQEVQARGVDYQDNTTVVAIRVRDPLMAETQIVERELEPLADDPDTVPLQRHAGNGSASLREPPSPMAPRARSDASTRVAPKGLSPPVLMLGGLALLMTAAVLYLLLTGSTPPKPGVPSDQAKSTQAEPAAATVETKADGASKAAADKRGDADAGGQPPKGSAAADPAETNGKAVTGTKSATPSSGATRSSVNGKPGAPDSAAGPSEAGQKQKPDVQPQGPAAKPKAKSKGADDGALVRPEDSSRQAIGEAAQADPTRDSSWSARVTPGSAPSDDAKAQSERRDQTPSPRRNRDPIPQDTHPAFSTSN